ncbi:MAG: inositol monophosphatase family protein [Acidimicrobiales bacterium]
MPATPAVEPALLEEAVELCRQAGELSLGWFRSSGLRVDRKGDGTPVTEADRGIERFLRQEIGRRYPDDGVTGEEEGPRPGTSGREWIIDPIDGTKAFTRGVPLYANLLAVEDGHGSAIGVINVPALGEMVWAGRGRGCYLNGVPTRVSGTPTLRHAYVSSSGFEAWDPGALLAVKKAGPALRTWGDGYGYLLVVTGRIDAMVDPVAERYDLAAMPVLLAEAGGRFSDLTGAKTAAGGNALATNGRLHDELLSLLAPRK